MTTPETVEQARDALQEAVDAITHEITMEGELDAVDDGIDALIAAVRAEEQAKAQPVVEALKALVSYCVNCDDTVMRPAMRQRVQQARAALSQWEGKP